jgi:hypothetical protein
MSTDQRLRLLETSVRKLEPLITRFDTIQDAVARLESQQNSVIASIKSLAGSPSQLAISRVGGITSVPLRVTRTTVNRGTSIARTYVL